MNHATDTYAGECRRCGHAVRIQTKAKVADAVASKDAKWVRCADCRHITHCERVTS